MPGTIFTIRHTMTNSSSCCSDNSSAATHRAAAAVAALPPSSLSPFRPSSHLPSQSSLRFKGRLYDYRHAFINHNQYTPPSRLIAIRDVPRTVRLSAAKLRFNDYYIAGHASEQGALAIQVANKTTMDPKCSTILVSF